MSLETTRVLLRGRQDVRVAYGKCDNRSLRLERSCLKIRTCDGHWNIPKTLLLTAMAS